ncbi:hypothetical protein Y032_0075g924 [Ancylostoma ceylanicum]|uniref:Tc1-like transposase DDE domain-containing protein n=1 Tax=Ancylostoma ceylanicum TaxID=53326 RepID=A0A016TVV3_9BILA|nr:hypothetical protein Y032_0075g924 [Ancylostoma ceylanicum]
MLVRSLRTPLQKLLGQKVTTSPPYRPNLAPEDLQLFLPPSNTFQGKECDDEGDLDRWLSNFFESVPVKFPPKESKRFRKNDKE